MPLLTISSALWNYCFNPQLEVVSFICYDKGVAQSFFEYKREIRKKGGSQGMHQRSNQALLLCLSCDYSEMAEDGLYSARLCSR